MDTWFDNVHLGIRIARRKLRTSLFGHPSQRRIKEYQSEINSHFNDLEQHVFLNELQDHKGEEDVEITTYEDDNLYAPCIKQLLWDHFRIGSRIVKHGNQPKVTISRGNVKADIDVNHVKSYITFNLYHQFNLYQGSIPITVCKFIRELEAIVKGFGIFKPQNGIRVYWTIDAEAQLAYMDNKKRMSTNIFSSHNKSALLLSETLRTISRRLRIPHTYFIPTELLDHNGRDALGNTLCNIEENRKTVRELPSHASVAFHSYHHDEYRKLLFSGNLTQEYVESEIRGGKALADEAGIEVLPCNRYPSLFREPFSLTMLEKHGFRIDTSDLIDDSALGDFSAYCRYRLLKLDERGIRPSQVWEIPVIYADPYIMYFNIRKLENLVACIERGGNYHNSEVALMFHDKTIGFPGNGEIVYNLEDGRSNRTGHKEAIRYLQDLMLKESVLKVVSMAPNGQV